LNFNAYFELRNKPNNTIKQLAKNNKKLFPKVDMTIKKRVEVIYKRDVLE
tara:strand:+ start:1507 stop:1656 length:150 start_codon:yes stop_codon:yes gene_type:complete